MKSATCFIAAAVSVAGHGHMVYPASTRQGGSTVKGGDCRNGACLWFSNNVEIPGEPTLPHRARSVLPDVDGGEADIFRKAPWRAPGTAPVFGHGCGLAGGDTDMYLNGGTPPKGIKQGLDGLDMPAMTPTVWTKGGTAEVGWAISANHGGGYSYRLCKKDGVVNEECFQKNQLKFAGNTSWIQYADGNRTAFEMTKVTEGVHPAGSEWARDPAPGCNICDSYKVCGTPMTPVAGSGGAAQAWDAQVNCYARCGGGGAPGADSCPDGTAYFPESVPGISGMGKVVWDWSVMDEVVVPKELESGEYLLSWRWDCEESTQVWQNCADITIAEPQQKN